MSSLRLLINQINSAGGVKVNEGKIMDALEDDFDVAIFPELFYSGYLKRDNIFLSPLDLKFVERLKKNIGERALIFGAPVNDGFFFNSAVVITKTGMQVYKKMHLPNFGPFEEMRYFKRGDSPFAFSFMGFKIGLQICYDLFFSDSVVKGVDLILNISASPFTSRHYFESVFHSRAIENQAYLVYVNTVGLQRNQIFWGGSRVVDPDGNDVSVMPYFREDISKVTLSSESIETSRRKRRVLSEAMDDNKE